MQNFFGFNNREISEMLKALSLYEKPKGSSYEQLGEGYELRPIEMRDSDGNLIDNEHKYSHLYKGGEQVCDLVFRKGGIGGTFRGGYCVLLNYELKSGGFGVGTFVIINSKGEITIKADSPYSSNHPSIIGGRVASMGNCFYDMETGAKIAPKGSSGYIAGKTCVIFNHEYSWYNEVELPLGVYKIDMATAEVTKIDDIVR